MRRLRNFSTGLTFELSGNISHQGKDNSLVCVYSSLSQVGDITGRLVTSQGVSCSWVVPKIPKRHTPTSPDKNRHIISQDDDDASWTRCENVVMNSTQRVDPVEKFFYNLLIINLDERQTTFISVVDSYHI